MPLTPVRLYFVLLGCSFGLSLLLTPLVRKLALDTGQVAAPKHDRWHKEPTPLLGGIGIFCSCVATWGLGSFLTDWSIFGRQYLPILLCSAGIFFLGLADDISNMDPQHKLAGQIILVSILLFFGFRLEWTNSRTVNLFLSILWLVGITNAFNLLDNMDGLSAGVAFIAGAFLSLLLFMNPDSNHLTIPLWLMSAGFLGALLGFLVYNFNPASIFMGDCGSLFIGFVLACLTMLGSPEQGVGGSPVHLLSIMAIPVLILFIPILDTTFVSLMRKLSNRPISVGGRDHSSHRMVAIGFSERKAVVVLYVFSAVSGGVALIISRIGTGPGLVIITLYLLFIIFFWIYLAKVRVYPEEAELSGGDSGVFAPILVEITYRRRLFEVLLDLVLITAAYYTSYLLRFEGVLGGNFDVFLKSLPVVIACQMLSFYLFGVYRGVWESTSLRDVNDYLKAISSATIMSILILLFLYRFRSFSRAVFVIYWVLMLIFVSLSRLSFRLLDEGIKRGNQKGTPTLIYGAGVGGTMLIKEIETNRDLGLKIIGFIDDNPRLHRRKVQGYPVLGGQQDLREILKKHEVRRIIVSFKENGTEKRKEIGALCQEMGAEVEVNQLRLIIS